MKLKRFTVGPILGATSTASARLWGRGEVQETASGTRRCFGIARLREAGSQAWSKPQFFKLNPNFDMTGLTVFDKLTEAAVYKYQAGWFFSDVELPDLGSLSVEWSDSDSGTFTTASGDQNTTRSYIFGSCRYLLKLFGGSWFDDRGDKTFRSILKQIDSGRKTHGLLMVGDQIYADDLNFLLPDVTIDQYYARYRDVFSQEYVRRLMGIVPTYMTLDDHEIEDNWPSKASTRDWIMKYPVAIHAYLTYQLSHSPVFVSSNGRITGVPDHLWYTFSDGCCDFFVMDTRTERSLQRDASKRQIIGDEQHEALKSWLTDASPRVKLIVSAVPFFPDSKRRSSDTWSGFLHQRTDLLQFIENNRPKKVVFLSGDVHCSMSAELHAGKPSLFKVISVVSSAFFWPYPHARASQFQLKGSLDVSGQRRYHITNASPVDSTDNFTRLTVRPKSLKVEVFSRKGVPLRAKTHLF